MPYDSLVDFLTVLEDTSEVLRIGAAVDPKWEVAAITDRVVQRSGDGGPALWFSAVRNTTWPVVTNLLGHPQRICRALGLNAWDHISSEFGDAVYQYHVLRAASRTATKPVRQAVCQQVIKLGRDVNLWELPTLTSWPGENHGSFSGGIIVTPTADDSRFRISRDTLAVTDRQTLLPHWTPQDIVWDEIRRARQSQRQFPVAIVFGADPRLTLAAESGYWFAEGVGYDFAALLQQGPLETVKCRTHDLQVPAEAEVVIEGLINPDAVSTPCEPVGLSNGVLSREMSTIPIMVTAVTHRANPIFPARIIQGHPSEDSLIRLAVDQLFQQVLRRAAPGIVDVFRPPTGLGKVVLVSFSKRYPYQARTIASALRGLTGLSRVPWMILVDADVNIRREDEVWRALALQVDASRDLLAQRGPADWQHPSNQVPGSGSQLTIDATRKFPAEGGPDHWPARLECQAETHTLLASRWSEYGLPVQWGDQR